MPANASLAAMAAAAGLNPGLMAPSQFAAGGALLSLNPGTLGGALSPALMSNSTLATIQGQWQFVLLGAPEGLGVGLVKSTCFPERMVRWRVGC